MYQRLQRDLTDEDRARLERLRAASVGKPRFDAKITTRGGAAGLVVGFLLVGVFHWGNPFGLGAVGAAIGLPFDYRRARRQQQERQAAEAAHWASLLAAGSVERVVAEASGAVRIDDRTDVAWFLQVADQQVLCLWHWADATAHVEVDLVPGSPPTTLKVTWTGDKLAPARPTRKFKGGERKPGQCEVLAGTLDHLDTLLKEGWQAKATRGA